MFDLDLQHTQRIARTIMNAVLAIVCPLCTERSIQFSIRQAIQSGICGYVEQNCCMLVSATSTCAPDQRVGWLLLDAMPAHRTFVIGIPAVKTVLTCYMHYVACLKYEQGQKKRPRTPQT